MSGGLSKKFRAQCLGPLGESSIPNCTLQSGYSADKKAKVREFPGVGASRSLSQGLEVGSAHSNAELSGCASCF
jgi:hypothetical protein